MLTRRAALGTLLLACIAGCGSSSTGRSAADASTGGTEPGVGGASAGGRAAENAGAGGLSVASGGAPSAGGATGCDANRPSGIPANSGTVAADIDGVTESGNCTVMWAAEANHATATYPDGSSLRLDFPGCAPATYSAPPFAAPIAITYTAPNGTDSWACTYLAAAPSAACNITVTSYGAKHDDLVAGTFSGTLAREGGGGTGDAGRPTRTVTHGTFTMMRP
jgi:hypothetical protein